MCFWNKEPATSTSGPFLAPGTEVFMVASAQNILTFEQGIPVWQRSDTIHLPGVPRKHLLRKSGEIVNRAQKPVGLMEFIIDNFGMRHPEGRWVIDSCAGTAPSLWACMMKNINWMGWDSTSEQFEYTRDMCASFLHDIMQKESASQPWLVPDYLHPSHSHFILPPPSAIIRMAAGGQIPKVNASGVRDDDDEEEGGQRVVQEGLSPHQANLSMASHALPNTQAEGVDDQLDSYV